MDRVRTDYISEKYYMTWYYNGQPLIAAPEEHVGFVYEIHDLITDRLYIGKKLFWTTVKLPPLKGKRNKRHRRIATDWQDYFGSNDPLKEAVALHGPSNFQRTILYMCNNKNQMSYWETKTQFDRNVLFDNRYYNGMINCRITSRGLKTP